MKNLINNINNLEHKKIIEEFSQMADNKNYVEKYFDEKDKGEMNYFYLTKISFNDKIEKILEDISIEKLDKYKDDNILIFKNCLVQLLSYENFYYLTEFKKINENKNKKGENINNINNEKGLKSSLINSLGSIDKEDADFKNIIFPKIEDNLISEMNLQDDNKLIMYCTSYLKLNIEKLPQDYINKNYSLLFDELIAETKNKIEFLNSNLNFEFYQKINEAEKINILSSNYNLRIKNLEKLEYIQYLYLNLELPYIFSR